MNYLIVNILLDYSGELSDVERLALVTQVRHTTANEDFENMIHFDELVQYTKCAMSGQLFLLGSK